MELATRADRILTSRVTFWVVVLLTFGLRLSYALNTTLIGTDAEYFIWMAQDCAAGKIDDAIYNPIGYHPLYPALIVAGSYLGLELITSAFLVSVVLSSLVVFPLFALVRDIWNQRVAVLAAFLYAVAPRFVSVGSDTMTDGPFLFFFVCSTTLLWFGFRCKKPVLGAAAGVFATAAYLTRVEGVYLLGCFTLLTMVVGTFFALRGKTSSATALVMVLVFFIPAHFLTALPYAWKIRELSGQWHFTMKGSMPGAPVPANRLRPITPSRDSGEREANTESARRVNRIASWKRDYGVFLGSTVAFLKYVAKGGEHLHLPLVIFGLLLACLSAGSRSNSDGFGATYCLFWTVVFWSAIYVTLLLGRNDSDARYYLPGWLFLFPWGALGLDWIMQRLGKMGRRKLGHAMAIVLALCLTGFGLLKLRKPIRYSQILIAEAAETVQSMVPHGQTPRVMATRLKFAFYAGTRQYSWISGSYEDVLRAARADQMPFLLGFRKDFLTHDPAWLDKVSPDELTSISPTNPDPGRIREVLVYRVNGVAIENTHE